MTAALTALRLETAAALFGEMPFPMLHDERRWSEFAMDARWTGVDALVRPSGSLTPLRGAKKSSASLACQARAVSVIARSAAYSPRSPADGKNARSTPLVHLPLQSVQDHPPKVPNRK